MSGMSRSSITAHWRIASYSSTSGVFLLRKMAMTMARPTVASAAATAMTIRAMTEPLRAERRDERPEGDDREVDAR